jgi:hypothetical protein
VVEANGHHVGRAAPDESRFQQSASEAPSHKSARALGLYESDLSMEKNQSDLSMEKKTNPTWFHFINPTSELRNHRSPHCSAASIGA